MNCEFAPVSIFSHAAIASLNNLEMMVYHYVIKNRDKVMYMTIRELAEAAGVSTTTVLRFCRKLQCEGYSGRRYYSLFGTYYFRRCRDFRRTG